MKLVLDAPTVDVLENDGSLLILELTFVICLMKCRIMQGHLEKGFTFSLGLKLEKVSPLFD
jgi:hypothetical protein